MVIFENKIKMAKFQNSINPSEAWSQVAVTPVHIRVTTRNKEVFLQWFV